jgi:hypothetical protein
MTAKKKRAIPTPAPAAKKKNRAAASNSVSWPAITVRTKSSLALGASRATVHARWAGILSSDNGVS